MASYVGRPKSRIGAFGPMVDLENHVFDHIW